MNFRSNFLKIDKHFRICQKKKELIRSYRFEQSLMCQDQFCLFTKSLRFEEVKILETGKTGGH